MKITDRECRWWQGRVKKTFKLRKRLDSLNPLLQMFPIPLPWEGIIFNFFSQIPLLSSYHVLSSPQEMGEQAFHTIGAIHFWADLPATVVSGIHASRDKSACQYKSHVYIGHKLMPAFFFPWFALPSQFSEVLPLASVFSFYIELSLETTRVISLGKEKEKYSMDLNWFCRPCEIQQWFRRFENPQTPQEYLSPTQDANLTGLHFIGCYPHLVQFFFLRIFQRTEVLFFGARSCVLHLPPTQNNLFAYGI